MFIYCVSNAGNRQTNQHHQNHDLLGKGNNTPYYTQDGTCLSYLPVTESVKKFSAKQYLKMSMEYNDVFLISWHFHYSCIALIIAKSSIQTVSRRKARKILGHSRSESREKPQNTILLHAFGEPHTSKLMRCGQYR